MLQQTRVETVLSYYERWLARFPTLQALAGAAPDDVLKAWEGLGYYSRARNFHRAVREVVERHHGRVPADPDAFR
ncbi:MAG TPA: A/G-specific adenine glycosylase, partial [Longimicrobiaceae bacterium]|nr:A/G-specific adenine glycosylase [Longimicrobiaceae bacterium]